MQVRVLSLNLLHGGISWDAIIDFFDAQKADILLLQEAYDGTDPSLAANFRTVKELQRRYPDYYIDFAPSFRDSDRPPIPTDRGNAILSTFPIISNDSIFFAGSYEDDYHDLPGNYQNCPRNLQHVVVDTGAIKLDVYNLQGVWDLDGDNDSAERLHMSQVITEAIQNKSHVILGGDTNVKPETQTIRNIEQHLHNVFGTELTTSFNMRRKTNPGYATAVVDMLFVSPNIQVLHRECPDIDISDHLPLIATFQMP